MKFARSLLPVMTLAVAAVPAFATPMVTDANLLSGLAANTSNVGISSYFNDGSAMNAYGPGAADYGPQNATNGAGGGSGPGRDFVFAQGDPDERIAITGFNSAITDIRVWTASDLAPGQITIYGSTTSQTSISFATYGAIPLVATTTLLPGSWTAGTGTSTGLEYRDFAVTAPAGTQSLLFDFGATNTGNPQIPGFVRIGEVQAFVPEPASLGLLGLGGLSLLARRRRA